MKRSTDRLIFLLQALGACLALAGCTSEPDDSHGASGAGASGAGPSTGGLSGSGSGGKSSAAGTGGSSGGSGSATGGTNAGGALNAGAGGSSGTASGGAAATGGTGAGSAGAPAGGSAGSAGAGASGGVAGSAGNSVAGSAGNAAGNAGQTAGGAGGTAGSAGNAGASGSGGGAGYSPCPTDTTMPCAVLPLGDSITEGFGSSGGGYRVELFRQAVQNGRNLTFVGSLQNGPNMVENQTFPRRHEGHGGYTIDSDAGHSGISGPITDDALADFEPHIVLLMIGTNDINGNVDVGNAPDRLGNLIDDITGQAPDTLVVVATIIPVANSGTNQRVQTYNAAIPELVSSRAQAGKHVVLLDNYAAFSENPNYQTELMGDSLHPNDAGYAVLGQAFYDAISASLPVEP